MSPHSEDLQPRADQSFSAAELMRELAGVSNTSLTEVAPLLIDVPETTTTSLIDTARNEVNEIETRTEAERAFDWFDENSLAMSKDIYPETFEDLVKTFPFDVTPELIQKILNEPEIIFEILDRNIAPSLDEKKTHHRRAYGKFISVLLRNVPEPEDENSSAIIELSLPEVGEDQFPPSLVAYGFCGRRKATLTGDVDQLLGMYMRGGEVTIIGSAGDGVGRLMSDGRLKVIGNINAKVGDNMTGGEIIIGGDATSEVGVGMLGGKIEIGGSAGERAGHQMAAGDLLIKGSCGSGLGLDAFGGRISILGKVDRKNMGIGSVTSSLTVTNGAGFWKHTLIRNGVVK